MYRIRRENGEEVSLGSIDEFGAAVAAGIVTAKAEIFHARAEKWLPIASHPHFKMAHDRVTASTAPKPPRAPAVTASGQRPALGASGQRPALSTAPSSAPAATATAPRQTAPQLRVMRPEVAPSSATPDAAVTEKAAPRWNTGQRPAARAVAPKPSAPPGSDLRLLRADTLLSSAATAPELPEIEFELLPEIEVPALVEPVAAAPVAEPVVPEPEYVAPKPVVAVAPEPVMATVVEHTPANVELVSHEEQSTATRGEVEIINPDRTMPVVSDREVSALEIPAPIRDFAPAELAPEPEARSSSKTPLFVGLGLVAAAAAVIGFFVLKPSQAAPSAPSVASQQAPAPPSAAPVAVEPTPVVTAPAAPVATTTPTGASTGLGGDVPAKKPKKSDDAQTASRGTSDGLEPPPEEVLPAAPTLGSVGDAAALPSVDAGGARNDAMDREKALEKTRREIDSSMRR